MKKIFAILLFPLVVNAEPGPVTQYLINEPATLLDIGMMRLEALNNAFRDRVGLHWTENGERKYFRAEIHSQYDEDDDRIYVGFLIMTSEATETQMEEGCKNAMAQLRIWLMKSLPDIFLHIGYDDPSKPQDIGAVFREMVVLRCYVSSERDTSKGRFWASQVLKDSEMTIGRWELSN